MVLMLWARRTFPYVLQASSFLSFYFIYISFQVPVLFGGEVGGVCSTDVPVSSCQVAVRHHHHYIEPHQHLH